MMVSASMRSGSASSAAEQTEIARFWDYSLPAIYHGVVRSVALAPNRDLGILLNGEVLEGVFQYQIGVFNGVPDGASAKCRA